MSRQLVAFIKLGIVLVALLVSGACALLSSKLSSATYYNIQCAVFDNTGRLLRKFGGTHCVFFSDGSFASGNYSRLAFYTANVTQRWSKPIAVHHQLNLSLDGQRLLVMAYVNHIVEGVGLVQFDKLMIFDLWGNEVAALDFYDHQEFIKKNFPRWRGEYSGLTRTVSAPSDLRLEFSHANSFYEIPDNLAFEKNAVFRRGNFLVNINGYDGGFVAVLDSKLSKFLWAMPQPGTTVLGAAAHDVQMQASGWLLLYSNIAPGAVDPHTSIDEINPLSGEVRRLYHASPPQSFWTRTGGGVQRLPNNHLILSDNTSGGRAFEVNAKGETLWSFYFPMIDVVSGRPYTIQQVKREDLSGFLRNNKGL